MKLPLLLAIVATASAAGQQSAAPKHPAFQLDTSAKRALVEKAVVVKPGDSYQSVTNRLGTPTYDQELIVTKKSGCVATRTLKYYAVLWEKGLVNELHDELVEVSLGQSNRVQSVYIRVMIE